MSEKQITLKLIQDCPLFNEQQKKVLFEKISNSDVKKCILIKKELKKGLNDYNDLIDETYLLTDKRKHVLRKDFKEWSPRMRASISVFERKADENEADDLLNQLDEI